MNRYILSCASAVDLTPERMAQRELRYICFHLSLDGQEYADDMGKSISVDELYQRMIDGAEAKTSQVTVSEYLQYFDSLLSEGQDLLHVEFSSGLSGSFNSAHLAIEELKEKYPDRKILLVDSLAASTGYGLIMETLADMRDAGRSIDELYQWIEENKLRMHHWFFSTDLTFYIRGGRISKAAGMMGTILNICPLLNMDCQGKLKPREKIRGKKKVVQRIVEMMAVHAQGGLDYCGKCYICHSACMEDAKAVKALVEAKFPKLQGKIEIYPIGATIGCHSGPGTMALFFWGDERAD